MNLHLRAHLDATVPPLALTPMQIADLRGSDAVLTLGGTVWFLRHRSTGRYLLLPAADMAGQTDAEVAETVEHALDRLDALPYLHATIPPIRHLSQKNKS